MASEWQENFRFNNINNFVFHFVCYEHLLCACKLYGGCPLTHITPSP